MNQENIVEVEKMLRVGDAELPLLAPDAYLVNQSHA
jgi:hypothetical protein